LQSLPAEWPQDHVLDIQKLKESNSKILVVLDDDPTGTQTVHDIEVLTEWYVLLIAFCHFSNSDFFRSKISSYYQLDIFMCRTVDSLIGQFKRSPKCFFILTNSRALSSDKVKA